MDYYDYKFTRRTADLRPWGYTTAIVLVTVLLSILAHSCDMIDDELPELTRAQRAEVIGRLNTPLDREEHISLADRILTRRVENAWKIAQ